MTEEEELAKLDALTERVVTIAGMRTLLRHAHGPLGKWPAAEWGFYTGDRG